MAEEDHDFPIFRYVTYQLKSQSILLAFSLIGGFLIVLFVLSESTPTMFIVKLIVSIVVIILLFNFHGSQVTIWWKKFEEECNLKKEEPEWERVREELATVSGFIDFYKEEAAAMEEEIENDLITLQELRANRQPHPAFICPITYDVMRDPQMTADGYSYEGEAITSWFASGHTTSPLTNLNLPHCNLLPNHTLRAAIED